MQNLIHRTENRQTRMKYYGGFIIFVQTYYHIRLYLKLGQIYIKYT